jgi:hypothetical protein
MGWWESADGTGVIGDRPADILGTVLFEAFGDPVEVDLFAGFLAAVGSAILRNASELVAEPIPPQTQLVAHLAVSPPVTVVIWPVAISGGLDAAVFDAVEAVAFAYRQTSLARPPRLEEIAETIAFVSRGHLADAAGRRVDLERITVRYPMSPSD